MSQSVYERVKAILDETPITDDKQRARNDREALRAIVQCASEVLGFDKNETKQLERDVYTSVVVRFCNHYSCKHNHDFTS